MTSQTQGIQQLLAAEKRAAEKVAEARTRKARRLRQAKEEAQEEVEKYRNERDRQFREFEAKRMGSREDAVVLVEKETQEKLDHMDASVKENKDRLIEELLRLVYDMEPEIHRNYQPFMWRRPDIIDYRKV